MQEIAVKMIIQFGSFGLVVAIVLWLMFVAFPQITKRFDAMLDRSDVHQNEFLKALSEQRDHCENHTKVLEAKVESFIQAIKGK